MRVPGLGVLAPVARAVGGRTTRLSQWKNSFAKVRDRVLVPKVRDLAITKGVGFSMTDLYHRLRAVVRRYVYEVYIFDVAESSALPT